MHVLKSRIFDYPLTGLSW